MSPALDVPWSTRLTGVVLALGVSVAHVADQGGVTTFNDTADWLGWAYRLVEVGGIATALALLFVGGKAIAWVLPALLGFGPAISFVASRTIGLPGDSGDKGNWAWDIGALSLVIEVAIIVIALGVIGAQLGRGSSLLSSSADDPAMRDHPASV